MEMTQSYIRSCVNPFRPGSGLSPTCLAGRFLDVEMFSSRLYSTITGTPKNILVWGNSQMGKTSLIVRMERIAHEKKLLTISTIVSPVSMHEFIENMVLRVCVEMRNHDFEIGDRMDVLLGTFQGMSREGIHENEIAFTDFILNLWMSIQVHVPAIVFTIDDLDLLKDAEEALLLLQNITKILYRKNCPVVFVITVSATFYENVQKGNHALSNYFECVHVGKLQHSSLMNAVRVPLWEMDISFDEAVVKEIARRADGFPLYLQQIAHHVFEEMDQEVDTLALRRGYERALQSLERDLFIPMAIGLTPTETKIYIEIFQNPSISFTQLLKNLKIPRGSVASSLKRLKAKQMIQQDQKMYEVHDRLFGAYLERKFRQNGSE